MWDVQKLSSRGVKGDCAETVKTALDFKNIQNDVHLEKTNIKTSVNSGKEGEEEK